MLLSIHVEITLTKNKLEKHMYVQFVSREIGKRLRLLRKKQSWRTIDTVGVLTMNFFHTEFARYSRPTPCLKNPSHFQITPTNQYIDNVVHRESPFKHHLFTHVYNTFFTLIGLWWVINIKCIINIFTDCLSQLKVCWTVARWSVTSEHPGS